MEEIVQNHKCGVFTLVFKKAKCLLKHVIYNSNLTEKISEEKARFYQEGIELKKAAAKLKDLIKNKNKEQLTIKSIDGEEAVINRKTIGKMLAPKTVNKSVANGFTKEQHFAVASDIENLFKNSIKILTHPNKEPSFDIKAIHRFISPIYKDNGAFITVRELTEHGKKIYSIELVELGKLEGISNRVKSNYTQATATNFPIDIIYKFFQKKARKCRFFCKNALFLKNFPKARL
jgi:hypothetical protein